MPLTQRQDILLQTQKLGYLACVRNWDTNLDYFWETGEFGKIRKNVEIGTPGLRQRNNPGGCPNFPNFPQFPKWAPRRNPVIDPSVEH